jgi:cell pole-organizing protein PopZ
MTEATTPEPSMPEPTMDEILASIRRIISDDMVTVAPSQGETEIEAADADTDVLLLTERAPLEPWAFDPSAEAEPAREPVSVDQVPAVQNRATALSPATVTGAADSFERLYFVVENPPPPTPLAVSAAGPTLEDLTRDLLRPMVKAWLDENLDAIVRDRVDAEVERISRGRVR